MMTTEHSCGNACIREQFREYSNHVCIRHFQTLSSLHPYFPTPSSFSKDCVVGNKFQFQDSILEMNPNLHQQHQYLVCWTVPTQQPMYTVAATALSSDSGGLFPADQNPQGLFIFFWAWNHLPAPSCFISTFNASCAFFHNRGKFPSSLQVFRRISRTWCLYTTLL